MSHLRASDRPAVIMKAFDWSDFIMMASDQPVIIMIASDWSITLIIASDWSGLGPPGHWTVHHHVSSVRHPPDRLQHEPRPLPGLGPGVWPLLGQPLALLAGPHLRRGGRGSHLPAPPQGQALPQLRIEQHMRVAKILVVLRLLTMLLDN